jgi:hypothetical protein
MTFQILLRHWGQTCLAIAVLGLLVAAGGRYGHWPFSRNGAPSAAIDQSRRSNEPDHEVTADHQFKRLRHKNSAGVSPLELVKTPDGIVTIQRTFSSTGTLIREEAFLDGKPVPIPKS